MKCQNALCIAGAVVLAVLMFGIVLPSGSGFTRTPQRMTSESKMRQLASSLIAYAKDHSDEFPTSIFSLSDESFEQYGFDYNLYAGGDHIRSFTPADVASSPLIREVFSHHSYIVTKDRRHLLVFERPGLWDDHTEAYLDLDISGKWTQTLADGFEGMKATRVTEQQFARYISKLAGSTQTPLPADELVTAAKSGDSQKVKVLLDQGISVNNEDQNGWTALTAAAQEDQPEMVELLISRGAQINRRDDFGMGRTALMRASALGHAAIIDALLAHGADLRVNREDRGIALMDALPYPAIVLKLIKAGADSNQEIRKEWSPLIAACSAGYAESARLLIDHGADLKRDGLSALDGAARNGQADAIDTLLSKGLSVDKKFLGECLSSACSSPRAMKRLISAGADPNAKCGCPGGRTALMVSALNGYPESVALLIAADADLNSKDNNGHTVLDLMLADTRSEWIPRTSFEKAQLLGIIDSLRKAGAKESGLYVEWPEPR